MSPNSGEPTLNTLSVATDILACIKRNDGPTFTDIATEYEMAKSTVHGYLSTLENLGLITKEDGRYYLGLELFHLGQHAKNRNEKYSLAAPKVSELAEETGEGADFMVFENGRLYTLYNEINSGQDPNFQEGRYFHIHNSAGGKAMLAALSDEEIVELIDTSETPKETERTITDTDRLMAEMEEIRERGYAVCDEEFMTGVRSVGAVVTAPDGSIFGMLGIGGPAYRIDDARIETRISKALLRAVEDLERELERNSRR